MIDFIKVGKKITHHRKLLSLTQDELADKLFVTRQLVSKWENGVGVPSIDILVELTKVFNTSIEELLCLNESINVDENDIFKGQNRLYVVKSIIDNKTKVDIPSVFYQFSPLERMMVLKAILEGKITINKDDLLPKLTPTEQKYLYKGVKENDFK